LAKSTGDMARQAKRERAKCRLCGRLFDSNHTFGVPGQMAPGEDVSDRTGDTVEIELCGLPTCLDRTLVAHFARGLSVSGMS
jgi:hypothetical protein